MSKKTALIFSDISTAFSYKMNLFKPRKVSRVSFVYFTVIIIGIYCVYRIKYMQVLKKQIYESNNSHDNTQANFETTDDDYRRIQELKASYLNMTNFPLFQPLDEVEFPTIEDESPRIPHIIHQIWENDTIPDCFMSYMQSFVDHNPDWEYRFWTYESGRKLLKDRLPYLLDIYESFGKSVKKSDLLRYAILYEFGGVYADIDVKNVRSLDLATVRYACILPTETFEHSTILNQMEMIINTAVLLCRPKHPFFKKLLLNLQVVDSGESPVHRTGPGFITRVYMNYNNLQIADLSKPKIDTETNSPYFYKGTRHEEDEDGIYIPNTQYFMDTVDPFIIDKNGDIRHCIDFSLIHLLFKRGCAEYEHRKGLRKRRTFAFTVHYWTHLWAVTEKEKRSWFNYVNVKDIVPTCILY